MHELDRWNLAGIAMEPVRCSSFRATGDEDFEFDLSVVFQEGSSGRLAYDRVSSHESALYAATPSRGVSLV